MGAHSRGPQVGKHRGAARPLPVARTALQAGAVMTAAGTIAGAFAAVPAGAATSDDFARLRGCESGGNYADNTGNGYYGAYQFDLRTWRGMGNYGLPSDASPAVQDNAAARLQAARGWEPWPACSARLGLYSTTASRSAFRRPLLTSLHVVGAVPAFDGHVLSAGLVGTQRADVRVWQARMAQRGWRIGVDGYFGPQSASVAAAFAAEKGLHAALPGEVDAAGWRAAWTAPIT